MSATIYIPGQSVLTASSSSYTGTTDGTYNHQELNNRSVYGTHPADSISHASSDIPGSDVESALSYLANNVPALTDGTLTQFGSNAVNFVGGSMAANITVSGGNTHNWAFSNVNDFTVTTADDILLQTAAGGNLQLYGGVYTQIQSANYINVVTGNNGNINLNPNGTGQARYNGYEIATKSDIGGYPLTFGNGLTNSAGTITAGGALSGNITWDGGLGRWVWFKDLDSFYYTGGYFQITSNSEIDLTATNNNINLISTGSGKVLYNSDEVATLADLSGFANASDHSDLTGLTTYGVHPASAISENNSDISGSDVQSALNYLLTHDLTTIVGQNTSSDLQSPGASEDQKVINWDHANSRWNLKTVSGGSGGTSDHSQLSNRDLYPAHPAAALSHTVASIPGSDIDSALGNLANWATSDHGSLGGLTDYGDHPAAAISHTNSDIPGSDVQSAINVLVGRATSDHGSLGGLNDYGDHQASSISENNSDIPGSDVQSALNYLYTHNNLGGLTTYGVHPASAISENNSDVPGSDVQSALDHLQSFTPYFSDLPVSGWVRDPQTNEDSISITFDNGTRTITRTLKSGEASASYYIKGTKYEITTSDSLVIGSDEGLHYVYTNSDGNLVELSSVTRANLVNYAFTSVLYWDADNSEQIYIGKETHGIGFTRAAHWYHHTIDNAVFYSGYGISNITTDGSGGSSDHITFDIASGTIYDEDIEHTGTHSATPTDDYEQILQRLQAPVYYRDGVSNWRRKDPDLYPLIYNDGVIWTNTLPAYNYYNNTVGTVDGIAPGEWGLREVSSLGLVNIHVFATNSFEYPVIIILGQQAYGNVGDARTGINTEINNLVLSNLPGEEFVPLHSMIVQVGNAYSNTPKARFRSTDDGDYIDWRGTNANPVNGLASSVHNELTNRDVYAAHPASAISENNSDIPGSDVQSALNYLEARTTFDEADFRLYQTENNNLEVDVDLSNITQSRSVTMPDTDVNLGSAKYFAGLFRDAEKSTIITATSDGQQSYVVSGASTNEITLMLAADFQGVPLTTNGIDYTIGTTTASSDTVIIGSDLAATATIGDVLSIRYV